MKKIILSTIVSLMVLQAAPAIADHKSNHKKNNASSTDNASSTHVKKGEVNLVCMQNVTVKRDNAVISAIDIYVAAARKSIETRRDALKAAWIITDKQKRKEALRTAWENDKNTRHIARKAFKKSKNNVWETFRTDRKVCKDKGDSDEDRGSSHDDL